MSSCVGFCNKYDAVHVGRYDIWQFDQTSGSSGERQALSVDRASQLNRGLSIPGDVNERAATIKFLSVAAVARAPPAKVESEGKFSPCKRKKIWCQGFFLSGDCRVRLLYPSALRARRSAWTTKNWKDCLFSAIATVEIVLQSSRPSLQTDLANRCGHQNRGHHKAASFV
jgi:hypothetical protein